MKELNPIDAYKAINKFLYYGWNFDSTTVYFTEGFSTVVKNIPTFIVKTKWNCNRDHILSKWNLAYHMCPANPMSEFWKELDKENSMALVEFVIANYNDEPGKAE